MNIPEMVARNARMFPQGVALVDVDPGRGLRQQVTWKELDERIDRVAGALLARGVKPGDRVSQLMFNSTRFLEIFLGILRCGAWAAPLSYRLTDEEVRYCVEFSETTALFVGEEFVDRVAALRQEMPVVQNLFAAGPKTAEGIESYEQFLAAAPEGRVDVPLRDEDGAALYYTSGTTGKPKAILLSHKNMECAAITNNHNRSVTRSDNFLLLPPLYHAGSIMMWYAHVIVGAPSTILRGVVKPGTILEAMQQERTTILFLVTAWAQDILGVLDSGEAPAELGDLGFCRLLCMGAQPIPPALIRKWKDRFPHMAYITDYGLGEANGPGCMHLGPGDEHKWGSIGKPSFNWECRVVDPLGNDVPVGGVGELIVRGNGVMRMYYKDPERTAETLRDGWCYTGDMAKKDAEGYVWLVDRKKDLVISGGENIFPVEIEEILHLHPKVYDVAVIGVPDERLGEVPVAIVDPWPGQSATEEEVLRFCEEHLARFKRPKRIYFDKIPRNPTGKIEKPRLRLKYAGMAESFRA